MRSQVTGWASRRSILLEDDRGDGSEMPLWMAVTAEVWPQDVAVSSQADFDLGDKALGLVDEPQKNAWKQ